MRKIKLESHLAASRAARRGAVLRVEDLLANPTATLEWLGQLLGGIAVDSGFELTTEELLEIQTAAHVWPTQLFDSALRDLLLKTGSEPLTPTAAAASQSSLASPLTGTSVSDATPFQTVRN